MTREPCRNCGLPHATCCARCGAPIRTARSSRGDFCSRQCADRQALEDRVSAEL